MTRMDRLGRPYTPRVIDSSRAMIASVSRGAVHTLCMCSTPVRKQQRDISLVLTCSACAQQLAVTMQQGSRWESKGLVALRYKDKGAVEVCFPSTCAGHHSVVHRDARNNTKTHHHTSCCSQWTRVRSHWLRQHCALTPGQTFSCTPAQRFADGSCMLRISHACMRGCTCMRAWWKGSP